MSKKEKKQSEEKTSFFSKLKDIWSVPRYKALIKLGLYVLFFLTLFLISQLTTYNAPKNKDNSNKIDTNTNIVFESYTYTYTIKKGNDTVTYSGTSTETTLTGIRKKDNVVDSYIIDKVNDKTYINGKEDNSLYEVDSKYLSYSFLDGIINNYTDNKYIDGENNIIEVKREVNKSKKIYDVTITGDDVIIINLELHKID